MRCPRCGKNVRQRRNGSPYYHRNADGRDCASISDASNADLRAQVARLTAERDELHGRLGGAIGRSISAARERDQAFLRIDELRSELDKSTARAEAAEAREAEARGRIDGLLRRIEVVASMAEHDSLSPAIDVLDRTRASLRALAGEKEDKLCNLFKIDRKES